jgi:hypothetical protein
VSRLSWWALRVCYQHQIDRIICPQRGLRPGATDLGKIIDRGWRMIAKETLLIIGSDGFWS